MDNDPDLANYINNGGSVAIVGFKQQKQAMLKQMQGMQQELQSSTATDPNQIWTIEQQAAKEENALQQMYQKDLAAKDAQVFDKPPPNAYPHKRIPTPAGGVMASHYVNPKVGQTTCEEQGFNQQTCTAKGCCTWAADVNQCFFDGTQAASGQCAQNGMNPGSAGGGPGGGGGVLILMLVGAGIGGVYLQNQEALAPGYSPVGSETPAT